MAPIRVLVCDDQAVVREGLEMILNADAEIQVIGLAADGLDAIELAAKKNPDLVLMDLMMPGMNGIRATEEIHRRQPEIRILVLTTFGEDEWVFDAIRAGAAGYLLKGTPGREIIAAIKGTHAGKTYIDPEVGGRLLDQLNRPEPTPETRLAAELTPRELDVLKLIARGYKNSEIAEALHVTRGTVRNYVSLVLAKLGVEDRTQAALMAVRHGLVD
jgi:DNA-binding NarL/FixJ family response regulator